MTAAAQAILNMPDSQTIEFWPEGVEGDKVSLTARVLRRIVPDPRNSLQMFGCTLADDATAGRTTISIAKDEIKFTWRGATLEATVIGIDLAALGIWSLSCRV